MEAQESVTEIQDFNPQNTIYSTTNIVTTTLGFVTYISLTHKIVPRILPLSKSNAYLTQ